MPKSQFVTARRLKPMIVYFAVAFLVILLADAAVQAYGFGRAGRQTIVIAWLFLFPLGGYFVWRRG